MNLGSLRVAGAPISWGVCEVPGWGYQMDAERVLREAASLGLEAIEGGPDGFLPREPANASRMLADHGLRLVGGFVPAVLHDARVRETALREVERQARLFAEAGAEVLVLSASTGREDYEETVELDDGEWEELFRGVAAVGEIGERYGLTVAVHPHFGTVIERRHHVPRFLEGCEAGLCLDTGHLMVGGSDPVEVAGLAAGRVTHVHLKDVDRRLATAVASGNAGYEDAVRRGMYRPLGDGDVDIAGVLGLLRSSGYGGWFVLEQDVMLGPEPGGEGPVADVRKSLDYLEDVAGFDGRKEAQA